MDLNYSSCAEAEPFALRVIGDSMEPEFKDGVIVIIDPTGVAANGSYVLAVHEEEYIFRQLVKEGDKMYLKALNENYPRHPLPGGVDDIKGVIVQQAGRRRKDRKHYV
ncbi:MAG: S24 family peptidase [Gammaproteobacteria bacterium]|nr:S24 family peptidase [Gammaproteobacteria bacterium]